MSESTVKVEEGTLVGYRVQGAQRNRDGSETYSRGRNTAATMYA